ncbi:MAG TPA: hypothetical protein VHX60_08010 [Acidobacteriaceae bacterium]|jgi:hypothetical protein|nr:hypothetical protein [Acidobacteriaceae bacterium]
MSLRQQQNLCFVLMFALVQIKVAGAAQPEKKPVFEHDAKLSEPTSIAASEGWSPYFASSGIVFLSDQTVAEYVLRSQEGSLLQRHERQVTDGYMLTITLFDLEQKKAVAKNDIAVPGRFVRLFRSKDGNLILCTQSWIALLSPALQELQQVRVSERFGNEQVLPAVDIDGEHLYLAGDSAGQCPNLVQVLEADSLVTQGWWCLKEKAQDAFYGDTAVQYHERRDSILQIYRNGSQSATIHPSGLIVAAQAISLPGNLLLVSNGGSLLGYDLGKGEEFFAPVAQHWNIVSPISCDVAGDNCAMALAIPKLDPFDVARKTTYKDVAVALVNSRDGKVRFQQSIRNLFSNPSRIGMSDLSDISVTVAPDGKYVGVWHGSTWEVYPAQ